MRLYHGTNSEGAEGIAATGEIQPGADGRVYLSPRRDQAALYPMGRATQVFAVDVAEADLDHDFNDTDFNGESIADWIAAGHSVFTTRAVGVVR